MRINIKARLKNKVFLVSVITLVISIVYKVLSALDIVPSVDEIEALEIFGYVVDALAILGVIVDPTTEGLSDSERALTYFTEYDVRGEDARG